MLWLSGDQNGKLAPSDPGSGRFSVASSGRTQSMGVPSRFAMKATCVPSGDSFCTRQLSWSAV